MQNVAESRLCSYDALDKEGARARYRGRIRPIPGRYRLAIEWQRSSFLCYVFCYVTT